MKFQIVDNSLKSQKVTNVNFLKLSKVFEKFLKDNKHFKGVLEVSLNLTICGNERIRSLNREYRQKDKVTDVLSFGVHENLRPDNGPFLKNLPQLDLGDIIICKNVALKQAKEFEITYEMEVIHLMVHGLLHLLGFDHEISSKEELIMEKYEQKLVKKIYRTLGFE